MFTAKHDYDSDSFYDDILAYAVQGLCDAEIADALDIDTDTFSAMKNGKYIGWNDEQNTIRGKRILGVLARGRRKTNAIVRGAYLKAALGGKVTRNKATVFRAITDDNGNKVGEAEVQRTESEIELPPNIQALATWLYHHDPEWRKVQRGLDTEAADIPTDIDQGIDIDAWIRKETEINNSNTNNAEFSEENPDSKSRNKADE